MKLNKKRELIGLPFEQITRQHQDRDDQREQNGDQQSSKTTLSASCVN